MKSCTGLWWEADAMTFLPRSRMSTRIKTPKFRLGHRMVKLWPGKYQRLSPAWTTKWLWTRINTFKLSPNHRMVVNQDQYFQVKS